MKKCFKCKEIKDELDFYKNKTNKDGLESYCRKCSSNLKKEHYRLLDVKEKQAEHSKEYLQRPSIREKRKEYLQRPDVKDRTSRKMRVSYLKRKYNISLEEYNEKYIEQGGKCMICGKESLKLTKGLFVDHNHITNKVRGLLCVKCNMLIGYAEENPSILKNSIIYLEKYLE